MPKTELIGLPEHRIQQIVTAFSEPSYRGRQLYHALYRERQWNLRKILPLPAALREQLGKKFQATLPEVEKKFQSADGTSRFLLRLADSCRIEAVRMPEPKRTTICLSTQAGCAVDCQFCLTGVMGFTRNLTPGEIVGQLLLLTRKDALGAEGRINLVFMGMGEPLLNYENVMDAVRLLSDSDGMGLSVRRMTLSTSGIVPGIEKLGKESIRPKLAVSLSATTDTMRDSLVPINRKWPLSELLRVCREFPLRPREKLTFEYVLLAGVNDTPDDARRLSRLIRGIPSKVNLIGLNPGPELPFKTPPDEQILRFQQILVRKGVPAYVRKPRGRDIFAACGQLKLAET